jgi:hypothetical protein
LKKKKKSLKSKKVGAKKPSTQKKVRRRNNVKYPALDPKFYSRLKREFFDIDYLAQLSDSDKEWLNAFLEVELNASFTNSEKKVVRNTKANRKRVFRNNYTRMTDIHGIMKSRGALDELDGKVDEGQTTNAVEELLVAMIDHQNQKKK